MREFGQHEVFTQGIEQGIDPRFKRIRDICRRELEDHLGSNNRTTNWDHAIYHFAQEHLDDQLSRDELKELFRQVITEQESPGH